MIKWNYPALRVVLALGAIASFVDRFRRRHPLAVAGTSAGRPLTRVPVPADNGIEAS